MTQAHILDIQSKAGTPHIGLNEKYRAEVSNDLGEILASTYQLVIKSQIYHWNVVGPLFKPLHELTEDHYNTLFEAVDIIAERIRALGHLAPQGLASFKGFAPEKHLDAPMTADDMIEDLIDTHEAAVVKMREIAEKAAEHGDAVTEDMLTDRLTFHEKALWMLRATAAK